MSTELLRLSDGRAVFSCDTSGWAFGPVFVSDDAAWAFETFLGRDPRTVPANELHDAYLKFIDLPLIDCLRCGELVADVDGRGLCPRCRECEWCRNDDVIVLDRGMDGWLCASCSQDDQLH